MAELKEKELAEKGVDVISESVSSLTFDDKVIKKIVGFATSEISGIFAISGTGNLLTGITDILRSSDDPTKGISVEVGKKQVSVEMKVICEYGLNIPKIFQSVIDRVTSVIKEMTGLDVVKVNIHVYDVLTKEEFERQSRKRSEEKIEAKPEVYQIEEETVEAYEEDFAEELEEEFEDSPTDDKTEE